MMIEISDLKVWYPLKSGFTGKIRDYVKAVNGISLSLEKGSACGIVGESGCGKTTLAKALMGLEKPYSGRVNINGDVYYDGNDYHKKAGAGLQMIFQDPNSSLNPRHTVSEILRSPFLAKGVCNRAEFYEYAAEILSWVGLKADCLERYPHEFSGGQRQRIAIARALGMKPDLLICDEVVSALDVSVQAQILELLLRLNRERQLGLLFISHDLSVINTLCDHVYVMYKGRLAESGETQEVFANARHPYTQLLLDSVPKLGAARSQNAPSAEYCAETEKTEINNGCAYMPRCPRSLSLCADSVPDISRQNSRSWHCHHPINDDSIINEQS